LQVIDCWLIHAVAVESPYRSRGLFPTLKKVKPERAGYGGKRPRFQDDPGQHSEMQPGAILIETGH
jgi:hypothetical protein